MSRSSSRNSRQAGALLAVNAVGASASAVFSIVGLARPGYVQLLVVAGLVQLLDAGLRTVAAEPADAVLPAAMGLVHLASARVLPATRP